MLKGNDRTVQLTNVLLIGLDGEQLGVVSYSRAKELAAEAGQDLVMVAERANPPVVRIMNFGKLCYEQKKNQKAQRKVAAAQKVKEVKFHINIDQHDYETKIKHVQDFFEKGFRVKVTLALRGREMAHQNMAFDLMNRVTEELIPVADPDGKPKMMGRNITVGFTPKSGTVKKAPTAEDEADTGVEDVETSDAAAEESEE
ncbi:MAG: translation initiation factor IF-3 [Lentisphaeria bacterium]|nr:translation initiation factor IF-3 [Lentisphaeria bacterium]